jgi:PST family polysaccharide transporter
MVETLVAIIACAVTGSAAGLVVGLLTGTAVEVIASWRVRGFTPRLRLDASELRHLMRFGRWVFASRLLAYLSETADDLIVGRFAGMRALGLYRAAYRVGGLPTNQVANAIAPVALPFLARMQTMSPEVRNGVYVRYLALTGAIAGAVATVLTVTAPDLVMVVLGSAWADASTPLALLAIAGFVRAVLATGGAYFMAYGSPQLDTLMQAVRAVVLVGGIAIFFGPWGIDGVALASLLSVVSVVPFWLTGLKRLDVPRTMALRAVVGPLSVAVAAGSTAYAGGLLVDAPLPSLAATGGIAIATWLIFTALFQPSLYRELVDLRHQLKHQPEEPRHCSGKTPFGPGVN